MQKYLKQINSVVALSLMLITGCATHNDAKLEADMVILTRKMQALNAELITLKAKQAEKQQSNLHLAKQN